MRYEDAGQKEYDLMNELIEAYFQEAKQTKVKILFDTRRKVTKGKIRLGELQKTNDLIRHLTQDQAQSLEGFDYIIVLDEVCWKEVCTDEDKVKLMRHELRHMNIDWEKSNPYGLRPHDIEDFVEEVKLNSDDVDWAQRVAQFTSTIYEERRQLGAGT